MKQKRNEWQEVNERYGKTKRAVVVEIESKAFIDYDYDIEQGFSEEQDKKEMREMVDSGKGNFYGVRAEASVYLRFSNYIQHVATVKSGGLYGLDYQYNNKDAEKHLKEEMKEQVAELESILKKMNIRHDKASVNESIE